MITADNLFFSYTGSPPFLLSGVNLQIQDGDYISVVGDNGCGKSTLIRILLKFLRPTRGSVVTEARRTGYVPQRNDFSNVNFPITVYEMLDSYRRLLKIREKETVSEALRQVGLANSANALMGTLSGGQSQKALIARAMLGSPELLILDEPSTGVDPDSQKEIYGLIKKLNTDKGITIVSVEHNLDAAISNSTLIYHLIQGCGHMCTPRNYAEEYLKTKGKGDFFA